ncbi:sulfatase-like hydrolase/transferase [Planctomycetota bacterium]
MKTQPSRWAGRMVQTFLLVYSLGVIPAWATNLKRPNVLFFFTDDQRASTIGALGNPHIHTPHLDQLVSQGTAFTRAYMMGAMTGATCIPSRAMLHTGRHLFHLRNQGKAFSPEDTTLGETFRAVGYTTYFTGKRHSLTRERINRGYSQGGIVMGFGGYLTDKRRMPMHDWDPAAHYANQDAYIVSGAPGLPKVAVPSKSQKGSVPAGPFATQLYVNPAVEWIQSYKDDTPWFLYVALSAPHDPHEAPDWIRQRYDPNTIPLPENFQAVHPFDNGDLEVRDEKLLPKPRDPQQIKQQIADYYASVTFVDSQFGRLLKALDDSHQRDNTLIVFAGDSGLAVGQHGLLGKQNLYDDAGVRIPMIMSGPGIPQNERRSALVTNCDIFPTLCELAGVAKPRTLDGKSLLPVLKDSTVQHHDAVYLAYRQYQRAIVEQRYKLIEYVQVQRTGTRMTQLFDLQADPWETTNLAPSPTHADTLKRLQRRLIQLRQRYDDGTDAGKEDYPEMHGQYRMFWENYR